MTLRDFKFLAALIGCIAASLFCLSWALQTLWIASFQGQDNAGRAVWFYSQVAAGFLFAMGGLGVAWKWWKYLPGSKRRNVGAVHDANGQQDP